MPQPPLILHHYPMSPFAEKVRTALGIKGLAWHSVETAPMPPRPALTPLTGGYRRIPVLQVGADIFCDTNIILPTLDRLTDHPLLFPRDTRGVAAALSFNVERAIWRAVIGVGVHFMKKTPPEDFLRDRKDDYLYFDMSKSAMEPEYAQNLQRVRAQLTWLVEALADRRFLAGDEPGALDLAYFHPLWFVRGQGPAQEIDRTLGIEPIIAWFDRMAAIGHGTPTKMSAEAALAAAEEATPAPVFHVSNSRGPNDPKRGSKVTVTPDDFACVPVAGTLVAADTHAIILHRTDPQAGDLHVHFPRAGFELKAA